MMNKYIKHLILFLIGGGAYVLIEILFRGFSHWSMFILGGICFVAIGLINEIYSWDMAITSQAIISAGIVTTLEFITGVIVNIVFDFKVWDYSLLPYNLLGQICLLFSILWVLLSIPAILIDDWLRYKLMGEDKPHYKVL